jgi:16S rRNA (cytidine1402-2'-O)-methyltransferase
VTAHLLRHFDAGEKKLISYFAGNEPERVVQIVRILLGGDDVALVSDAGTPGISDPGARLVSASVEAGISVVSLPGPTAAITALVASGLPTDAVVFEGFLPIKKGRQTALRELAVEPRTIVLYESPYRIVRTLTDLAGAFGDDRRALVAREITKLHEELVRGGLGELRDNFAARSSIKGEFVLVVAGTRHH